MKGAKHMYATSIRDHLVKQFDFANDHALAKTVKFDGAGAAVVHHRG